jgi:hypothetical protein
LRLVDVTRRFLADGNNHDDLVISRRKAKKTAKPARIEPFHRAGVQAQGFRGDHQIFAGQRGARGPLEQALARDGRHADDLEEIHGAEGQPLQGTQKIAPTLNEEPLANLDLRSNSAIFSGERHASIRAEREL